MRVASGESEYVDETLLAGERGEAVEFDVRYPGE